MPRLLALLLLVAAALPVRAELATTRLAAWIPWWRGEQGVERAVQHMGRFAQLSPFGFRAQDDGTFADTLKSEAPHWGRLKKAAAEHGVDLLPTFVWNDGAAVRRVLLDTKRRRAHVRAIVKRVAQGGFAGADLDYERVPADIEPLLSNFIRELDQALEAGGKRLSCTIPPRSHDRPPDYWKTSTDAWAYDHGVLGRHCDQVRLMAYDQWRSVQGDRFVGHTTRPQVEHADLEWVERVTRYALKNIPAHKLWLGVATYGWQFDVQGEPGSWRYAREQARSFPHIKRLKTEPRRAPGGELLFDVVGPMQRSLVIMPNANSIATRAHLAQELGLAGVVLFKLDGLEDPRMWQSLPDASRTRARSRPKMP